MSAASIKVHNRANTPPDADHIGHRCLLAVQAKVRGYQELRVVGQNGQSTGTGRGVISIRVGQVLLYLEDREALLSWAAAIQRAIELQDRAYGPELPAAHLGPARSTRQAS